MRSSLWPLQAAIFERLSMDKRLNERVRGVFDAVSKDAKKPWFYTAGQITTEKKKHNRS